MKQIAVIGIGDFGYNLIETLSKGDAQIIAIDIDKAKVAKVKDVVTHAVQLDSTNESALMEAGFADIDAAVVCMGKDIQDNILTTTLLKRIGIPEIISRASSSIHEQILREVGATRIINPEKDMGIRLGRQLLFSKLEDFVDLSQGFVLADVRVPKSFVGKTIGNIKFRTKYKVNVIALKKMKKVGRRANDQKVVQEYNSLPTAEDILDEDSVLVLVGQQDDIDRIANLD